MKNTHKTAYQAAAIERLRNENRELQSELRAAEIELTHKDRLLDGLEKQLKKIREDYERYLFNYSERVEALEEAERKYEEATADARALAKQYKSDAESVIKEMRRTHRKEAQEAVRM